MKYIKKFVVQWSGQGYEKGEMQSFWLSFLCNVLNVSEPENLIRFEVPAKLKHILCSSVYQIQFANVAVLNKLITNAFFALNDERIRECTIQVQQIKNSWFLAKIFVTQNKEQDHELQTS